LIPEQVANLYKVQHKDIAKASSVVADAFRDDPIWTRVMPNFRLDQKQSMFEISLRYCLRYGNVYAPSDNLEGIITWMPGEQADMPLLRLIRSGAIWPGLKVVIQLMSKLGPMFNTIQTDRKLNMDKRTYIYLPVLGVGSAFQGQGYGGQLLSALIAASEQSRLPIYLETETENNVRWYTKYGFQSVKQINLPVINVPMWEMIRNPQT
jgi:ribosomal protein S18 acetylase RimI-like enzyme